MVKLENFSGLTKKQEDLLKKNYCFGSAGLLNINVVNSNMTFHSRVSEKPNESPRASAWLQFRNDLFLVKGKKRNDKFSYYKLEVTPTEFVKNFKAIFECKLKGSDGTKDPSISAEYNHEQARGKLTYYTDPSSLRAQVTFGKPEFGAGLDTKFQLDSKTFTSYNAAVWWVKKGSKLVLKHIGTNSETFALGNFEVSYFQKLNKDTHLGSKVVANCESKEMTLEVGGDYKYDANTIMKGKINSVGNIGLAFSRAINERLRATIATEVNSQSLISHSCDGYRLGVRFDFSS